MIEKIEQWEIDRLIPYARNPRKNDHAVDRIASAIREFGFKVPIIAKSNGDVVDGHLRLKAAQKLGMDTVPVVIADDLTDAQVKAFRISVNRMAEFAEWDDELLHLELDELRELDFDIELTGFDIGDLDKLSDLLDGEAGADSQGGHGSMAEKFMVPPFTVLNAREGWWQNRKRQWLSLGIKSEEGRDIAPTSVSANAPDYMAGRGNNDGGSIFDPVLCELAYTWFSPVGGLVLDPFAGGSVRGIVAAKVGRKYIGHELRPEQVAANRDQATDICFDDEVQPSWVEGDSRNIHKTCSDVQADFVFSCPPYADLEVYSDNPDDLSTMGYADFREAYFEIIKKTCELLKDDAFACFVVGEVRDKKGVYYNFVGDTIKAFIDAGLDYYNEAILVTSVGSLPLRAGRAFSASRKLGKTHQNVLVFVKGDGKKATQACGDVFIHIPEGDDSEDPASKYGDVV